MMQSAKRIMDVCRSRRNALSRRVFCLTVWITLMSAAATGCGTMARSGNDGAGTIMSDIEEAMPAESGGAISSGGERNQRETEFADKTQATASPQSVENPAAPDSSQALESTESMDSPQPSTSPLPAASGTDGATVGSDGDGVMVRSENELSTAERAALLDEVEMELDALFTAIGEAPVETEAADETE